MTSPTWLRRNGHRPAAGGHGGERDGATVFSITGARRGLSADIDSRAKRYLLSMGIRTICFLLAIFVGGWLRWVFIFGALVLPYIAVVLANGGREPGSAGSFLTPTPHELEAPPARPGHDTLAG